MYLQQLKKRKLSSPSSIPNNIIAHAEPYHNQTLNNHLLHRNNIATDIRQAIRDVSTRVVHTNNSVLELRTHLMYTECRNMERTANSRVFSSSSRIEVLTNNRGVKLLGNTAGLVCPTTFGDLEALPEHDLSLLLHFFDLPLLGRSIAV